MTRPALLFSFFLFSCGGSPDEAPDLGITAPEIPSAVADEGESDAFITSVPTGAFPTVEALCAKQMDMAAPNIAEANHARAEMYEGVSEESVNLPPKCIERRDLVASKTRLAAPFADLTAIEIETGYATSTFLVVRTAAGWTAVRQDFLDADHDDPGCPSITREHGFGSIRVENGELVVEALADRMSFDDDAQSQEIVVTRVRRCSITTCSEPEELGEPEGQ